MNMTTNALGMLGPDCGSWGLPARGSSLRSEINIWGNLFSPWVRGGTQMISRSFVCIQDSFARFFQQMTDNYPGLLRHDLETKVGPCDLDLVGEPLHLGS
jgi:hypothetical protein